MVAMDDAVNGGMGYVLTGLEHKQEVTFLAAYSDSALSLDATAFDAAHPDEDVGSAMSGPLGSRPHQCRVPRHELLSIWERARMLSS